MRVLHGATFVLPLGDGKKRREMSCVKFTLNYLHGKGENLDGTFI
jgi:hypothetical protein